MVVADGIPQVVGERIQETSGPQDLCYAELGGNTFCVSLADEIVDYGTFHESLTLSKVSQLSLTLE